MAAGSQTDDRPAVSRPLVPLVTGMFLMAATACVTAAVTGGPLVPGLLRDGTYEGSASAWPNSARVRIVINGGKIVKIDPLSHFSSWIGSKAGAVVPGRIIERQSTNVDAVTGATNSSRVIMNAVQNAVEQASFR